MLSTNQIHACHVYRNIATLRKLYMKTSPMETIQKLTPISETDPVSRHKPFTFYPKKAFFTENLLF